MDLESNATPTRAEDHPAWSAIPTSPQAAQALRDGQLIVPTIPAPCSALTADLNPPPEENQMTAVQRYRKKPVVIEARQFCGGGAGPNGGATEHSTSETHAIYRWVEKNTLGSFEPMAVIEGRKPWPESGVTIDPRDGRMVIATLEGGHWVNLFDWIIRGVEGEFYPCKPSVFAATYEPVVAAVSAPQEEDNQK